MRSGWRPSCATWTGSSRSPRRMPRSCPPTCRHSSRSARRLVRPATGRPRTGSATSWRHAVSPSRTPVTVSAGGARRRSSMPGGKPRPDRPDERRRHPPGGAGPRRGGAPGPRAGQGRPAGGRPGSLRAPPPPQRHEPAAGQGPGGRGPRPDRGHGGPPSADQRPDRPPARPAYRPPYGPPFRPGYRPEAGAVAPEPEVPLEGLLGPDEELVAGRRPVEEAFAARRTAHRLLVVPNRRAALERGERPLILVLDSLEDPHNVGSLLRTAEAAGVHGVMFPTRHAAPLTPSAVKASAGAVEHLLMVPVDDLPAALADLHVRGLRLVAAAADATLTYREADLRGPLALVVGSEGRGLSGPVRRRLDLAVRIPMRGRIASLNAAVAGSVMLLEAAGQRAPEPPDGTAEVELGEARAAPPTAPAPPVSRLLL